MTKMVVEDLEQIISDTKSKIYNKRCYVALGAAGLFLIALCLGLLIAVIVIRSVQRGHEVRVNARSRGAAWRWFFLATLGCG